MGDIKPVNRKLAPGWKIMRATRSGLTPVWYTRSGIFLPRQWYRANKYEPGDRILPYPLGFHAFKRLRDTVRYKQELYSADRLVIVKVLLAEIHTEGLDSLLGETNWFPCMAARCQKIVKIYQSREIKML